MGIVEALFFTLFAMKLITQDAVPGIHAFEGESPHPNFPILPKKAAQVPESLSYPSICTP